MTVPSIDIVLSTPSIIIVRKIRREKLSFPAKSKLKENRDRDIVLLFLSEGKCSMEDLSLLKGIYNIGIW